MKRLIFILMVFLSILFGTQLVSATHAQKDLNQQQKYVQTFINKEEVNLTDFSLEAQKELVNLSKLYGEGRQDIIESSQIFPYFDYNQGWFIFNEFGDQLRFYNLFGKQEKNIHLQYWMNNRTLFRLQYAVLGLERKESFKENDVSFRNNKLLAQETTLGLAYQTSDRVTISADIIEQELFNADFSTILGVEYADDKGLLRYEYQIEQGKQSKQTLQGVLGLKDLAKLSASYKLLNLELLEDELATIWDFALDINLNKLSTFSIDYQYRHNDNFLKLFTEDQEESQINIEAKFEINF